MDFPAAMFDHRRVLGIPTWQCWAARCANDPQEMSAVQ